MKEIEKNSRRKDRKSETYDLAWSSFGGENLWWSQPRSQGSLLPALLNEVAVASRNVGCFFRLVCGGGGGSAQAAYHQTFLRFISEGPKEKPPSFPRDIRRTSWAWWKYRKNLQKKLVMPLPIIMQRQKINHCPFGMHGTIIHPLIHQWVVSHNSFRLLMLPAEIKRTSKSVSVATRNFPTFFVRWSWFCSTLLKISCIVR